MNLVICFGQCNALEVIFQDFQGWNIRSFEASTWPFEMLVMGPLSTHEASTWEPSHGAAKKQAIWRMSRYSFSHQKFQLSSQQTASSNLSAGICANELSQISNQFEFSNCNPKIIPKFAVRHENRLRLALDQTQCFPLTYLFHAIFLPHFYLLILRVLETPFLNPFSCHSFILISLDMKASILDYEEMENEAECKYDQNF